MSAFAYLVVTGLGSPPYICRRAAACSVAASASSIWRGGAFPAPLTGSLGEAPRRRAGDFRARPCAGGAAAAQGCTHGGSGWKCRALPPCLGRIPVFSAGRTHFVALPTPKHTGCDCVPFQSVPCMLACLITVLTTHTHTTSVVCAFRV